MSEHREFVRGFLTECERRNPEGNSKDHMRMAAHAWHEYKHGAAPMEPMEPNPGAASGLAQLAPWILVGAGLFLFRNDIAKILHAAPGPTATTQPPLPGGQTAMPPASADNAIHAWAQGIGLPDWVGVDYAATHGGQLPGSMNDLTNWGNQSGHRLSNGQWVQ